MKSRWTFGALAAVLVAVSVVLNGCSFQNKYEREADKITKAVIANNLSSVQNDLAPSVFKKITRVQIAALSDELNDQGKLESIHEVTPCPAAPEHCFTVKFAKSTYHETLEMDDQDKVTEWNVHIADAR